MKRRAVREASSDNRAPSVGAGDTVGGRYALEQPIGEGGFANVYRSCDLQTGETVAVKILRGKDELPEWQRRRFEREVESLRRINHPGIVRLLDSGWISESEPYVVMSFVDGPTLREVLDSGIPDVVRASNWVREIGDAVAESHAHGVLHRDLKPENILIADFGVPTEHVVIVDFGAAVLTDQQGQNGTSFMLVSFHYSAPERARGRSSTASDVYSLAAITFEMLTGGRFASLIDGDEREIRAVMKEWSGDVVTLLGQGTSATPSARPQDVRAFAAALADAIHEFKQR